MTLYIGSNNISKISNLDDPLGFTGIQLLTNQVKKIELTSDYKYTSIPSYFFYNLTNLEEVILPEKVKSLSGSSFSNSGIIYVNFPSVTSIANEVFSNCSNLEEVHLPSVDKPYLDAFNNCNNLKALYFDTATTLQNSIVNAEKLEILYAPLCTTFNCTFTNCGFKVFTFPSGITSIFIRMFTSCNNLEEVIIENGATFTISNYFIINCPKLTKIEIPTSISSISSYAFRLVENPVTITIDKPVDSIPGAPWGATNATIIWKDA